MASAHCCSQTWKQLSQHLAFQKKAPQSSPLFMLTSISCSERQAQCVWSDFCKQSAVTSLWLPTCSMYASPEEAGQICRQTGTWVHSAREKSSNKKADSRHFVPLQLLNAKYRKSLEQRAELGMWHCQGSAVIMGYGARLLLALLSLAFFFFFFSAQQLCFKGGARERLHSQLPHSFIVKVKGKPNLNWQGKPNSLTLRKTTSSLHPPSISRIWAAPMTPFTSAEELVFGCWADGAQGPACILYSYTPNHPAEIWKVPTLWARRGKCFAWSLWLSLACPDMAMLPLAWKLFTGKNTWWGNNGALQALLCPN